MGAEGPTSPANRGNSMTKTKLVLSTALIAQALAFAATPAVAGTTVSGSVPTQADLDASCQVYLHADVNGGFMAKAINAAQVDTVVSSSESEHVVVYDGEATLGDVELLSIGRNPGADKQIFGVSYYTTQTFPSGTESWTTTVVTESHINYDCKIYKVTKPGKEVVPSDKQRPGQVSASWTTTVVTDYQVAIEGGTETLDQPVYASQQPVCRYKDATGNPTKPGYKPAGWDVLNGYDETLGDCSDETYASADILN